MISAHPSRDVAISLHFGPASIATSLECVQPRKRVHDEEASPMTPMARFIFRVEPTKPATDFHATASSRALRCGPAPLISQSKICVHARCGGHIPVSLTMPSPRYLLVRHRELQTVCEEEWNVSPEKLECSMTTRGIQMLRRMVQVSFSAIMSTIQAATVDSKRVRRAHVRGQKPGSFAAISPRHGGQIAFIYAELEAQVQQYTGFTAASARQMPYVVEVLPDGLCFFVLRSLKYQSGAVLEGKRREGGAATLVATGAGVPATTPSVKCLQLVILAIDLSVSIDYWSVRTEVIDLQGKLLSLPISPQPLHPSAVDIDRGVCFRAGQPISATTGPCFMLNQTCGGLANAVKRLDSNGASSMMRKAAVAPIHLQLKQLRFTAPYSLLAERVVSSLSRSSSMARERFFKWSGAHRIRQKSSDVFSTPFHFAPFFRHSATLFPDGRTECTAKGNDDDSVMQKRVENSEILVSPDVVPTISSSLPVIGTNIDEGVELVPDVDHRRLNMKDENHGSFRCKGGIFLHRTSFSFSRTQGWRCLRLSAADIRRNSQSKCSSFSYPEAVLTTLESNGALLSVIDRGMPLATSVLGLLKGAFRGNNENDATTALWGVCLKNEQQQWQQRAAQFWIATYSRVGRLLVGCSRTSPVLYSRGIHNSHSSTSSLPRSSQVPMLVLVSMVDAVQGALQCPQLRRAFISTGGPLWLSAVHLSLPELHLSDSCSSSPTFGGLEDPCDCQVHCEMGEDGLEWNSASLDSSASQKSCAYNPTSRKAQFYYGPCRELQMHWQYGYANTARPLVLEKIPAESYEEEFRIKRRLLEMMVLDSCIHGRKVSVLSLMLWIYGDDPVYYTDSNCIFRGEHVSCKSKWQCHSAHHITEACVQRASGYDKYGKTPYHSCDSIGAIDNYMDGSMAQGGGGSLPIVPPHSGRTLHTLHGHVNYSKGVLGRVIRGSSYALPSIFMMPALVSTCGSNGVKGSAWLSRGGAEATGNMKCSSCLARAWACSNFERLIENAPCNGGPICHAERGLHGGLHMLIEMLTTDTAAIVELEALARGAEANLFRPRCSDLSAGNVVVATTVLVCKAEARAFSRRSQLARSRSNGFPTLRQQILVHCFSGDNAIALRRTTRQVSIAPAWMSTTRCSAQARVEPGSFTGQERCLPYTCLQAIRVQRQGWAHQLCYCALERSLHCSLLFRNIKPLHLLSLQTQSEEPRTGDQNYIAEASKGAKSIAGDYQSWARACCTMLSPLHAFTAHASAPFTNGVANRALGACGAHVNDARVLETLTDEDSVRSTISEIYAPFVHAVVAVFDALLQCCTIDDKSRNGGSSLSGCVHPRWRRLQAIGLQRACLNALLRELAESKNVLEVLSAHIGWLLSPGLVDGRRSSIKPLSGAPRYGMLPLMQLQAIRFLRRLTETCSKLQVSSSLACSSASVATGRNAATVCAVCDTPNGTDPANLASTALSAGAILLFWQESGVYSCLRNWLDAYSADVPANPRKVGVGVPLQMQAASWHHTHLHDVLGTLVAAISTDAQKLTGQNSVLLVRPLCQLLCAASSKAVVMERTSKPGISVSHDVGLNCPLRVLCRLCLHLLAALVDGRSVGEALEFHRTGAIRIILRIVLGVSAAHEPALSSVPLKCTKGVPLEGGESTVTPCSTALIDEMTYNVGDRIRARWMLDNGKSRWYPGEIEAIQWKTDKAGVSKASYTVRYDDGDVEYNKRGPDIKIANVKDSLRRAGSASSGVHASKDVASSTLKVVIRAGTSNDAVYRTVANQPKRDCASGDYDVGESTEVQHNLPSNLDDESEASVGSDDSNDMFMIIPSNLPSPRTGKPADRSVRSDVSHPAPTGVDVELCPAKWQGGSLSIDLRTVHAVASSKTPSLSTLDPLAGFSSLSGFGMFGFHSTLPSNALASTSSSVSHHEEYTGVLSGLAYGGDDQRYTEPENSSMSWLGADPVCSDLALLSLLSLCVTPGGRSIEASALEPMALSGGKSNWNDIVWKPSCSWESVFFSYKHTGAVAPGIDFSLSDLLAVVHRYFCGEKSHIVLGFRSAPLKLPAIYRLFVRCHTRRSKSIAILLQLLCPLLFDTGLYGMGWGEYEIARMVDATCGVLLGQGAFGKVISIRCPSPDILLGGANRVAIKLCNTEGSALQRVFNEVVVMKLSESKLPCDFGVPVIGPSLLEYGVSAERDEFILVMEQCLGGSLKVWRDRFDGAGRDEGGGSDENCSVEVTRTPKALKLWRSLLYLEIFREVTRSVCELADRGIIHFDLKCDNILLRDYLDSSSLLCAKNDCERAMKLEEIRRRLRTGLVCICDFGEACVVEGGIASSGVSLTHARGTECIQSPEVLLISDRTVRTYLSEQIGNAGDHRVGKRGKMVPTWQDRVPRRTSSYHARGYPSCLSDVWSLGCLLFELMTGDFLFDVPPCEGGWSRLFVMLVNEESDIFLEQKMDLLRRTTSSTHESTETSALTVVERLLRSLLVRNPNNRPTARQALRLVNESIAVLSKTMPTAIREYMNGGIEVKQRQGTAEFEPHKAHKPNKAVGVHQATSSCQPLIPAIVARAPNECSLCCHALFVWPVLVHPDLPVLVASRYYDQRSVGTMERCPCTPPATAWPAKSVPLVLPYVWMDAALPYEEAGSCQEVDVVEALGISHTVHIEWIADGQLEPSRGKFIAILSVFSNGSRIKLPCGASDGTVLNLAPRLIDRITKWTASARREGGRVLMTSSLFRSSPTTSLSRSADVAAAANDAVSTLAVAVHISNGSRNICEAILAMRSTHRAFALAWPEDITGWLQWRAANQGSMRGLVG